MIAIAVMNMGGLFKCERLSNRQVAPIFDHLLADQQFDAGMGSKLFDKFWITVGCGDDGDTAVKLIDGRQEATKAYHILRIEAPDDTKSDRHKDFQIFLYSHIHSR